MRTKPHSTHYRPIAEKVIGTNTGKRDDEKRAWLATDWLVRECAPAFLRCAGLTEHAEKLEGLAARRLDRGAGVDAVRLQAMLVSALPTASYRDQLAPAERLDPRADVAEGLASASRARGTSQRCHIHKYRSVTDAQPSRVPVLRALREAADD